MFKTHAAVLFLVRFQSNIKTEIHYHVSMKGSKYLNNPDIDFLNDKINR